MATIICGFNLKERILLDPTAMYRRWRDKGVFEIGLINFIQAIIQCTSTIYKKMRYKIYLHYNACLQIGHNSGNRKRPAKHRNETCDRYGQ